MDHKDIINYLKTLKIPRKFKKWIVRNIKKNKNSFDKNPEEFLLLMIEEYNKSLSSIVNCKKN